MKRDDLTRLHHIRNRRKLRALERVASSQAAVQRAEQTLSLARAAVDEQLRSVLEQESSGLAAMMGRTLSQAELANFRVELTILADRLEALRAIEQDAGAKREAAHSDLKAANAVFRERNRSVEKLQYVIRQESRKSQGKDLAQSEAADDEFHRGSQSFGQGKRPFGLGIGDV